MHEESIHLLTTELRSLQQMQQRESRKSALTSSRSSMPATARHQENGSANRRLFASPPSDESTVSQQPPEESIASAVWMPYDQMDRSVRDVPGAAAAAEAESFKQQLERELQRSRVEQERMKDEYHLALSARDAQIRAQEAEI